MPTAGHAPIQQPLRHVPWFVRDAKGHVLPSNAGTEFDVGVCMNPFVLRVGDDYHLYYAGEGPDRRKRICLAVAPVADPTQWDRRGVVLDVGAPGSFDAAWVVLPHVVQAPSGRWHLYYTANQGHGKGLSAFPGIGLATSDDAIHWTRHGDGPVLAPTHREGDPDAIGMAGGSVLPPTEAGGEWRFYYTGCPTIGDDVYLDQQKVCCLAVSQDGITWERRGPVMRRDHRRDYEDIAVAGPVVQAIPGGGYRMLYSAIGSRWGWYSICHAESPDGLSWNRGEAYGDNLVMGPRGTGWEQQMVEYPSYIAEAGRTRLFYCGNGYGRTGIGTALSSPLRALADQPAPTGLADAARFTVLDPAAGRRWIASLANPLAATGSTLAVDGAWRGPTAEGRLLAEWASTAMLDHEATPARRVRLLLDHTATGLALRLTLVNLSPSPWTIAAPTLSLLPDAGTMASAKGTPTVVWDDPSPVPTPLAAGETRTLGATLAL